LFKKSLRFLSCKQTISHQIHREFAISWLFIVQICWYCTIDRTVAITRVCAHLHTRKDQEGSSHKWKSSSSLRSVYRNKSKCLSDRFTFAHSTNGLAALARSLQCRGEANLLCHCTFHYCTFRQLYYTMGSLKFLNFTIISWEINRQVCKHNQEEKMLST